MFKTVYFQTDAFSHFYDIRILNLFRISDFDIRILPERILRSVTLEHQVTDAVRSSFPQFTKAPFAALISAFHITQLSIGR